MSLVCCMDFKDIVYVKAFSKSLAQLKRSRSVVIIADTIITHHSLLDTAKTPQTNGVAVLDGRLLGYFLFL